MTSIKPRVNLAASGDKSGRHAVIAGHRNYQGILMENLIDEEERAPKRKVLDLTVVQVVASALATVVGAVLASLLGVTGTIIGAAVVSTSATTGAAVFSHAFRRTGEGIRGRVPPVGVPRTPGEERAEHRADARAAFGLSADAAAADPAPPHTPPETPPEDESVTTYRGGSARGSIGWKKYALATGLVFALAMVTVTAVELIMGKPVAAVVKNEPGRGTSVGGGTAGTPGPADSGTPTPDASSGTAPQTSISASPDRSSAQETSSGPSPSSSPTSSSRASVSSVPSSGGAVSSSDGTADER
ncbi:hypothetical protein [Streptomyces sp. NBC_00258]|uniref:hypothetical protein n=1 Tax=Streptomyces sp. NBC_00258 TaxID=2903642 RepID=UPI002E2B881F|nr:hypothetical protein [Streptomyces sp. NBC_00258]